MIDKGATGFRLANTIASASELVITLLAKDQSVSHAEHLELRRRQAKWHTGTALICLPACPVRFTGLSASEFVGLPPPLSFPTHSSETAPLAFNHGFTEEDPIIALV